MRKKGQQRLHRQTKASSARAHTELDIQNVPENTGGYGFWLDEKIIQRVPENSKQGPGCDRVLADMGKVKLWRQVTVTPLSGPEPFCTECLLGLEEEDCDEQFQLNNIPRTARFKEKPEPRKLEALGSREGVP